MSATSARASAALGLLPIACLALSACGGEKSSHRFSLARAPGFTVVQPLKLGARPRPLATRGGPTILATSIETRVVGVSVPGGRIRTLLDLGSKRNPVMVSSPSWAPDGRSFVVSAGIGVGEPRVVIVQLGSGRRRTLTGSAFDPAPYSVTFSPDGRYLVVPGVHRAPGLYAYDLRRRHSLQMVAGPVASGSTVSWSPDARRIAFDRDGGGILVLDRSTRSVSILTRDGQGPAWSPDGSLIAFSTTRGVGSKRCSEDGCHPTSDIDVVRSNGTGRRRLTRTAGDESNPTWPPDGMLLVAQLRGGTTDYEAESGLVTFRPDGSCYRTLVPVDKHLLAVGQNAWRPGSGSGPRSPGC